MIKSIIQFLSLFAFILFTQFSSAQLSKKHFIPPLTSGDDFGEQYIYISTPKKNNVSYKIIAIGKPDLSAYSGIVSNDNPVVQIILDENGNADLDNDTQLHINRINLFGNKITDKGFIIEASDVVYVSVRVNSSIRNATGPIHGGALVSKGASALGTEFRIGGFVNEPVVPFSHTTFASLMATENNTSIDFTDLPSGTLLPSGIVIPSNLTLNEGESYIIALGGNEDPGKLIGKLIKSNKPIVVNSGSASGSFADNPSIGGTTQDYGFDQIVGADKIGSEYILVRGNGLDSFENVLIIAHFDNTEVKINGNNITTINRGQYYVAEGNFFSPLGNMYVETNKDVFVYQGIGGTNSKANQGLFFVPPLSCENKGNVDNIARIDEIGDFTLTGGITIVTNKGATISINDLEISNFNPKGPDDVTGNSNYVTYTVTDLKGNVKVNSSQELYCAYFNRNGAATTGAFYSGFPSAPEIVFNTTVSSLGTCIPNVTLQAANFDLFDSFEWQYFNELTGVWEFRASTPNYKPIFSEPGKYKLIGKVDCTGTTFESLEIPVSICPDDFDGDLIIDNLDVDIDNDGILNIDESLGNVIINLTDINNPSLIFEDNPINSTITSSNFNSTEPSNTFVGQNNGDFTSVLNPAISSNSVYELNFTQNINFAFKQSLTGNHTINSSEYFIIKIGPNNKNITLLDPDDQLLIDTNFDGEFESGVTIISASEIHFKFKNNLSGANSTFLFVANQVNQIVFEHKSTGLTSTSTFSGNIELTTFSKDSDGYGIEDMFDVDSDNDGIPDIFESTATKITLLGIDANEDGLDDIFEGIVTGIDTDGDGIPNYLDVDSDNDGIFDLVEGGHGGLDANNDGILDNANASNVGINGLLNSLESTIDAKILSLNYTITDTDNDDIFNFLELDSDNDDCFDVTEAGFTDLDNNGFLDGTPFATDPVNGKVINNSDGYTTPNPNYIINGAIIITDFNDVTFCEDDTNTISINSNADTFQWQVSIDGGTTWQSLPNDPNDLTYEGVDSKNLEIKNSPFSFNNNQYRVISEKNENTCSLNNPIPSNAITLTVNPKPILKPNPELGNCISINNLNPTINLTLAQDDISSTPNVTFAFYTDSSTTDLISNPTSYPVTPDVPQSVWVKVTSTVSECVSDTIELKLNVATVIDESYNILQPPFCDDAIDPKTGDIAINEGFDKDNKTIFSLDKTSIEIGINAPSNTTIVYYENITDRANNVYPIDITNFRNDITKNNVTTINGGIQFPIYYKIVSVVNSSCQGLGQFNVQIDEVPKANTVDNIELCDDALSGSTIDGQNSGINLRDKIPFIFDGTTQTETDYKVTFHKTQIGASTNTYIISNDTNFTNDAPSGFTTGSISEQTIFVRVQKRTGTECFNANTSFKIIIQPIPIVSNTISDLIVCDVATSTDANPRNRTAQNIDLTSMNDEIFAGKTNYDIEFYLTKTDAENRNAIVDPTNFQNTQSLTTFPSDINSDDEGIQTIFFVLFDKNGIQCPSIIYTFRVKIYPEPFVNSITSLSYCDDNDDGDDTNGIIQTIDLKGKIPLDPNNYDVTFHNELGDELISPYTNTFDNETIYVRVQNRLSGCINDRNSFQLIINPLPSFTVTSPQILCLNDLPLNISVEYRMDNYSYEWKNEAGIVVGTSDNINITSGGNYFVTATTTNGTLCSRTEIIEVYESNIATLQNSFVTIIDESNNIGSQNNLSISIDTVTNNLGPGDYQFAIINTDTNERFPFAGFQDDPLFENLEGGIYQIIVNDKNGCSPDSTLLVSVIQFPKFFTPNGDGQNDTWVVKGANQTFYPNASINIFNRYGKLVAQVPIDSQGWDGTYNGTLLPSDDYWYNITLIPADATKPTINKKGNFSLLRK